MVNYQDQHGKYCFLLIHEHFLRFLELFVFLEKKEDLLIYGSEFLFDNLLNIQQISFQHKQDF